MPGGESCAHPRLWGRCSDREEPGCRLLDPSESIPKMGTKNQASFKKSSAACTGTIWTSTVSHLLDDGEVDLAQRLPHHRTLPLLAALLLHLPCTDL